MEYSGYLTIQEFSNFMKSEGYHIQDKNIKFRRDVVDFEDGTPPIGPELPFQKVRGIRKLVIPTEKAQDYLNYIKSMSFKLNYKDVKTVVEEYAQTLNRPRKFGMRGNRNFTGKVEDEIRGKLVELGFSEYVKTKKGYRLPVDFRYIPEKEAMRDAGDFAVLEQDGKSYRLPQEKIIAVKSTNGYFLAIPEVEMEWEGGILFLAKLHMEEKFLYKVIKSGFDLDEIDYSEEVGWLEIRGWIDKSKFIDKAHRGESLPKRYHVGPKWRQINLIMHPLELNRNPRALEKVLVEVRDSAVP